MQTQEMIEAGQQLAADLEFLGNQFGEAVQRDQFDLALTGVQQRQNAEAYSQRIGEKVEDVRDGWLSDARDRLMELQANPPPPRCTDEKAKFFALHHLITLPPAERVEAIREAIAGSDRMVWDAAMECPGYVALMPPAERARLIDEWNDRHSVHPKAGFRQLAAVVAAVVELCNRLEQSARQNAAA